MAVSPPFWLDDSVPDASLPDVIGPGTVVVTGNFDGIHRGHQALFSRAVEEARARGLAAIGLTFDPHPRSVLGTSPPPRLTCTPRRIELIERLGVALVVLRRFDLAFAAWTAEMFVERLLVRSLHARVVVAGNNFRFGAGRAGDDALLTRLGERLGFDAFALEARDERGPLSSSRVRDAVLAGDVVEAERILGRPHSVAGVVEKGFQRGRTMGFPTANLGGVTELLPPDGVYAVAVDRAGDGARSALSTGVMNIGVRPTLGGGARRTIEAHLFDFSGDLYGQTLRVHFIGRLRGEQRFADLGELAAQISRDAAQARSMTAGVEPLAGLGVYG